MPLTYIPESFRANLDEDTVHLDWGYLWISFKQIPSEYLKLKHGHFLPNPIIFITEHIQSFDAMTTVWGKDSVGK